MSISSLLRPNILALAPYSCARDEFQGGTAQTVYLDANESPYGDEGLNRYPDPLQRELKQRIAEQRGVAPESIFLGNGSDEAIDLVYRVFCRPGIDNVVTLKPSYGMYRVAADINDVECREVALRPDFSFSADDVLAAADGQTKAVFLCSPNNPSGNLLPAAEIERVVSEFAGVTVVDEAYIDFAPHASWRRRVSSCPRLIVLSTFSKAWAAAGIRLGMAFANPEIISVFNKVKYPYNVNVLTQRRALQLLSDPGRIESEVSTILSERARLADRLSELPMVQHIFPSDANFLLVRFDDAPATYRYLAEHDIIVRSRHSVFLCNDCLRITVGTPDENDALIFSLLQAQNLLRH